MLERCCAKDRQRFDVWMFALDLRLEVVGSLVVLLRVRPGLKRVVACALTLLRRAWAYQWPDGTTAAGLAASLTFLTSRIELIQRQMGKTTVDDDRGTVGSISAASRRAERPLSPSRFFRRLLRAHERTGDVAASGASTSATKGERKIRGTCS